MVRILMTISAFLGTTKSWTSGFGYLGSVWAVWAIQEKLKEEQGVLEDKDGNQEVRRTVLAGERSDVLVQAREFLGR